MDKITASILSGSRAVGVSVLRQPAAAGSARRLFASAPEAKVINNEYVLRPVPGDSGSYYLAVTKDKMDTLKDLSFIDFTKQNKVQKDEYLLSVESAKTMFDFMSPATLEIIALNKKFAEQPSEDTLKQLKEQPELEENYLMIVKVDD
ncbi:glycine cleavage system protein H [Babesia caballi]|uniref:Glycine cleavage system protein H n=1 Tax=Babesia caballi TaxID=5871 RepID=A0AAV4LRC2_BABCB|nr:glycine cleavage system protein H [Babesia caballi]